MQNENVAMHAVATKASTTLNSQRVKTYKMAFEYPVELLDDVDALVGETVDIYWNEDIVALGAVVTGTTTKRVKDEPNIHIMNIDADAGDTSRHNLGNDVGDAGDLRLRPIQVNAGLRP